MQAPPAPASPQRPWPWPLPRWLKPPGALVIDIVAVALVGTAQIAAPVMIEGHNSALELGQRHLNALGITLLVISAVALAARRQRPVPVLVVTVVMVMLYNLLGYPHGLSFFSVYVAFYTAIVTGHRLAAWVGAAVLSANLWLSWAAGYPMDSSEVAWGIAGLVIVLGYGEVTRLRRAYLGSLRQRAIEAERTKDEAGRRMVTEERLHIARELHDLIGHNISLINVQASVALHLLERQPEQAAVALTAIKQVSKDTLDELRLVVGTVRGSEDEGSPRLPARGLGDLDALVSAAASADLDVRLEVAGSPRPVPAGLGLTAFRIVQESLTNVRRHAGPASVAVRLEYNPSDLTIRIEDNGRGLAESTAAHGGTAGYGGTAHSGTTGYGSTGHSDTGHGGTAGYGGADYSGAAGYGGIPGYSSSSSLNSTSSHNSTSSLNSTSGLSGPSSHNSIFGHNSLPSHNSTFDHNSTSSRSSAPSHGSGPNHVSGPNQGGRPVHGGGRGLTGMRERAAAVGGELDAGPRPGGGFQVVARLPLDPALGGPS